MFWIVSVVSLLVVCKLIKKPTLIQSGRSEKKFNKGGKFELLIIRRSKRESSYFKDCYETIVASVQ